MQKPRNFAVLTTLGFLSAAAAGSIPRGVSPEFVSYYQAKDSFRCIANSNIEISLSRVNDNTCDCPDGSDEPGTAACAHIDPLSPQQPLPGSSSGTTKANHSLPGFWCENKGHIGAYVPFVYVNDGICDYDLCCDGSEEYASVGGTKCDNRCAEIGKEYRRLAEIKEKKMNDAQTQRSKMISDSDALRKQTENHITELEDEIRTIIAQKNVLDAKYKELQKKDRNRVVKSGSGGKLGVLLGQAKSRVNELRETLTKVADERDKLRIKVNELDTVLRKLKEEYNPNFNDEGVKAAVKSFEDFAAREAEQPSAEGDDVSSVLAEDGEHSGINWVEFESSDDDTDILYSLDAYLPVSLREFIQNQKAAIRDWLVDNGLLAEKGNTASESQATREAREAKETAERDLQRKEQELENEKSELSKDYGPSQIFRSLKGQCIEIDAGEYTYELCWLDKTSQKSKKGHGNTNMGNFKRIDHEVADDEERLDGKSLGKGTRMVMRYEDGQACWNGPNRRTDVWLGCSDKEELWRVTEAEKCVYKMEVGTPAACDEQLASEAHIKDEFKAFGAGDRNISITSLGQIRADNVQKGMNLPKQPAGTRRLFMICLQLALGSSIWGYNIGILSSVLVHPGWRGALHDPEPAQKGLVTGFYYVGTLISYVFLSHPLADLLGRRYAAQVGTLVLCLGALVMAAAAGRYALGIMVVGRGICGLGVGVVSTTVPLYQRPRWLLQTGDMEKASKVLHWLREDVDEPADIAHELHAINRDIEAYRQGQDSFFAKSLALFREKPLFARMWRAFLLQFMAQMCGATAIKYYLPTLLKALGLGTRLALMAGAVEMTAKIGLTVVEMWIIDRFGRKACLAGGSVVMAVAMLINGALPQIFPKNVSTVADAICIAFIFVYAMGYSLGLGPAAWVYSSEIFPTTYRARGLNFAASGGSIGSIIVAQIWPMGVAKFGSGIYFFFFAVNAICVPVIWLLYPETKGCALEDMDLLFQRYSRAGTSMDLHGLADQEEDQEPPDVVAARNPADRGPETGNEAAEAQPLLSQ
ncbi:hypothetical protein NHJ6243_006447 [Beauveria neobassiana]